LKQAVEKVIKAMHFNKDSNKVPKSAVLGHIVKGLDPELQDMVMTVSAKVGKQEKMMYNKPYNLKITRQNKPYNLK
jgi:metal-dependent amidase/aminoacylase/carboxypeptidase family protein